MACLVTYSQWDMKLKFELGPKTPLQGEGSHHPYDLDVLRIKPQDHSGPQGSPEVGPAYLPGCISGPPPPQTSMYSSHILCSL